MSNTVMDSSIDRLEATVEAVEGDLERFNQAVWVRGTQNGRHAELCFACFAVELFGAPGEAAAMRYDGSYEKAGAKALGLRERIARPLFWGNNTLDDIKTIIKRMKGDRND